MNRDLLYSLRHLAHKKVESCLLYSIEDVMLDGRAVVIAFQRKYGCNPGSINGWEVDVMDKGNLLISRERKVIQPVFRSQYTVGGDYDQVYFTIDGEEFAVEDFIFPLLEDESYLDRYYSEDYCSVTAPQTLSPKT